VVSENRNIILYISAKLLCLCKKRLIYIYDESKKENFVIINLISIIIIIIIIIILI